MPKQQIKYASGFIRDVRDVPYSGIGQFTFEIDKFYGNNWNTTSPIHLSLNLIEGISAESVGKRLNLIIELEEELDSEAKE